MGKGYDGYGSHRFSQAGQLRTSHIWSDRFWGQHRGTETDPLGGAIFIAATALLLALALLLIPVIEALPHIFSTLDHAIHNRVVLGGICGIAAVACGFVLFQLRQRTRGVYAFLEIAFAFATAATTVAKLSAPEGDMNVWFGFAGAAYLMVRGLDNLQVAKADHYWPWTPAGSALVTASSPNPPSTPSADSMESTSRERLS